MSEINLRECHDHLVGVARKAGQMITSATPTATDALGTKKNSADLVTGTDQAVEKMVSTALREQYPDFELANSSKAIIANHIR